MKYKLIILVSILIISCSDKECYECKDDNASIKLSDQFPSALSILIPNFAIEGLETIRLVDINRLDGMPIIFSDASLTLKSENSESFFAGDPTTYILYESSIVIPVSLFSVEGQFIEGQIHFEFSATDSITNIKISIEGSFLFVTCDTYLDSDTKIEGIEDCRDNRNNTEWSIGDYGC